MKKFEVEVVSDNGLQFRVGDNTYRLFAKNDGSFLIIPNDSKKILKIEHYVNTLNDGVRINTKDKETTLKKYIDGTKDIY